MKKKCFAPCIIILAVLLIVLGVTSGYAVGNAWDRWIKTEVVVGDVMKKLILASASPRRRSCSKGRIFLYSKDERSRQNIGVTQAPL